MNKKVNDKFIGIKDIYVLQCICTEENDEIERLNNIINKYEIFLKKELCFDGHSLDWIEIKLQELKGDDSNGYF